ncbi:MAG: histidine kinase [Proteobacteria bacterium]|nr:histidine kinase [Pseudomonadota bacterium]
MNFAGRLRQLWRMRISSEHSVGHRWIVILTQETTEREFQWNFRLEAVCFMIVLALGFYIRTVLYQSAFGALTVSAMQEPITALLAIVCRPIIANGLSRRGRASAVAIAIVTCALAAILATAWAKLITNATGWIVPSWDAYQTWLVPWVYYVFVFASWNLAQLWAAAENKASDEAAQAAAAKNEALKAELQHLRNQLDPHFLFNALGGIASEITIRPSAAVEMVRNLADYLRYSLDHRDVVATIFASEIEAVRAYLDLQKARFGDDLVYEVIADKQARHHRTLAFLLQPLVENAVKHGLRSGQKPIGISVSASSDGDRLQIQVANTGLLKRDWTSVGDPGVGHEVLRRRLALHYPGRHRFDMNQTGATVTADLELRGPPCSV